MCLSFVREVFQDWFFPASILEGQTGGRHDIIGQSFPPKGIGGVPDRLAGERAAELSGQEVPVPWLVRYLWNLAAPERKLPDVAAWNLGGRELEVLQLLAAGQRNRAIAAMLHVSENTVKFHLRNIYRKLGATSRTEAIALAHSNGLR
jgi:DNA-binding CsgD family transcriptional regulator